VKYEGPFINLTYPTYLHIYRRVKYRGPFVSHTTPLHTHTHTHICICIHTPLHTHTHTRMHTYIHTYIHTYTQVKRRAPFVFQEDGGIAPMSAEEASKIWKSVKAAEKAGTVSSCPPGYEYDEENETCSLILPPASELPQSPYGYP
jgi:hypothetical protein